MSVKKICLRLGKEITEKFQKNLILETNLKRLEAMFFFDFVFPTFNHFWRIF